jgi:protein-L-isoaspartate(D-aspartate) O-methyltransferase
MINFEKCRRNMVDNQLRPNKVTDARVIAAMGAVPRERFVPEDLQGVAYVDEDLPIGEDRVLMEPMVLARMLQAAEITSDDVVLDIGSGTGYTAAVCAKIATTVVSVEGDSHLAAEASRILSELECDNVVTIEAAMTDGYPRQAPYDVILFSGAVAEIPDNIANQLAEGGRLVAVVAPSGQAPSAVLVRNCGSTQSHRRIFDASIPYLTGFAREPGFVF